MSIIFLHSHKRLFFVMKRDYVLFEVGTEILYIIYMNGSIERSNCKHVVTSTK